MNRRMNKIIGIVVVALIPVIIVGLWFFWYRDSDPGLTFSVTFANVSGLWKGDRVYLKREGDTAWQDVGEIHNTYQKEKAIVSLKVTELDTLSSKSAFIVTEDEKQVGKKCVQIYDFNAKASPIQKGGTIEGMDSYPDLFWEVLSVRTGESVKMLHNFIRNVECALVDTAVGILGTLSRDLEKDVFGAYLDCFKHLWKSCSQGYKPNMKRIEECLTCLGYTPEQICDARHQAVLFLNVYPETGDSCYVHVQGHNERGPDVPSSLDNFEIGPLAIGGIYEISIKKKGYCKEVLSVHITADSLTYYILLSPEELEERPLDLFVAVDVSESIKNFSHAIIPLQKAINDQLLEGKDRVCYFPFSKTCDLTYPSVLSYGKFVESPNIEGLNRKITLFDELFDRVSDEIDRQTKISLSPNQKVLIIISDGLHNEKTSKISHLDTVPDSVYGSIERLQGQDTSAHEMIPVFLILTGDNEGQRPKKTQQAWNRVLRHFGGLAFYDPDHPDYGVSDIFKRLGREEAVYVRLVPASMKISRSKRLIKIPYELKSSLRETARIDRIDARLLDIYGKECDMGIRFSMPPAQPPPYPITIPGRTDSSFSKIEGCLDLLCLSDLTSISNYKVQFTFLGSPQIREICRLVRIYYRQRRVLIEMNAQEPVIIYKDVSNEIRVHVRTKNWFPSDIGKLGIIVKYPTEAPDGEYLSFEEFVKQDTVFLDLNKSRADLTVRFRPKWTQKGSFYQPIQFAHGWIGGDIDPPTEITFNDKPLDSYGNGSLSLIVYSYKWFHKLVPWILLFDFLLVAATLMLYVSYFPALLIDKKYDWGDRLCICYYKTKTQKIYRKVFKGNDSYKEKEADSRIVFNRRRRWLPLRIVEIISRNVVYFSGKEIRKINKKCNVWPWQFARDGKLNIEIGEDKSHKIIVSKTGQELGFLGYFPFIGRGIEDGGLAKTIRIVGEYLCFSAIPVGLIFYFLYSNLELLLKITPVLILFVLSCMAIIYIKNKWKYFSDFKDMINLVAALANIIFFFGWYFFG